LKEIGSQKFGVKIVGIRRPPPSEAEVSSIELIQSGSVVHLTTEEEEKEFD